jgi:peptidoglycan/LPS O-acetylase OafA/YrhL
MRWFKPLGIIFVPVSGMGWAVSLLALAFCAQVFLAVDHHSHSVSDTLYGVFPFWAPTLLGLAWIADRTGGRSDSTIQSA